MKSPGKDQSGGGFSAMRIGRDVLKRGREKEQWEVHQMVVACSLAPLLALKSAPPFAFFPLFTPSLRVSNPGSCVGTRDDDGDNGNDNENK